MTYTYQTIAAAPQNKDAGPSVEGQIVTVVGYRYSRPIDKYHDVLEDEIHITVGYLTPDWASQELVRNFAENWVLDIMEEATPDGPKQNLLEEERKRKLRRTDYLDFEGGITPAYVRQDPQYYQAEYHNDGRPANRHGIHMHHQSANHALDQSQGYRQQFKRGTVVLPDGKTLFLDRDALDEAFVKIAYGQNKSTSIGTVDCTDYKPFPQDIKIPADSLKNSG